jgi:hypothetical protein
VTGAMNNWSMFFTYVVTGRIWQQILQLLEEFIKFNFSLKSHLFCFLVPNLIDERKSIGIPVAEKKSLG